MARLIYCISSIDTSSYTYRWSIHTCNYYCDLNTITCCTVMVICLYKQEDYSRFPKISFSENYDWLVLTLDQTFPFKELLSFYIWFVFLSMFWKVTVFYIIGGGCVSIMQLNMQTEAVLFHSTERSSYLGSPFSEN